MFEIKLKYNKKVTIPNNTLPLEIAELTGLSLESSVSIFESMVEAGCSSEIITSCTSGSGVYGINIEII